MVRFVPSEGRLLADKASLFSTIGIRIKSEHFI
jgi:hypothetical protein